VEEAVGKWSKGPIIWEENGTMFASVVFTWDLPFIREWARAYTYSGRRVVVGGPAVKLMPDYFDSSAEIGGAIDDAVYLHNKDATFTSRGCIRKCSFCAVPRIEGPLRELTDWPVRPIICDNNLLACSSKHFDGVIDCLKTLSWCDFNQGLDARLLTKYHADRLSELKRPLIRLAFDHIKTESEFMRAYGILRTAGIPKSCIRVYVLIGFKDTPDDALYRLQLVNGLGIKPNPMRYQELDALYRNSYVGASWTNGELTRFMRYWSNLRYLGSIPFSEWSG